MLSCYYLYSKNYFWIYYEVLVYETIIAMILAELTVGCMSYSAWQKKLEHMHDD